MNTPPPKITVLLQWEKLPLWSFFLKLIRGRVFLPLRECGYYSRGVQPLHVPKPGCFFIILTDVLISHIQGTEILLKSNRTIRSIAFDWLVNLSVCSKVLATFLIAPSPPGSVFCANKALAKPKALLIASNTYLTRAI